jgi:hypothetical protein
MKEHSFTLSPHEARAALDDRLGLVVRPVAHKTMCVCSHPLADHMDVAGRTVLGACGRFTILDKSPFGAPGTRLRCKETWKALGHPVNEYAYAADGVESGPWEPSTRMPEAASRITLEVESVRCCRLHQLCENDMRMALGVSMDTPASHELYKQIRAEFEAFWSSRYGRRYPWESNPWAWVVKVKRVEG